VAEKAHPPVSDENSPYQGIAAPLKTLMGGEVFSGGPGCPSSLSRVRVEQAMHCQAPLGYPNETPLQIMLICFRMDLGMAFERHLLHPLKRTGPPVHLATCHQVQDFKAPGVT
jgi:hypothetical protein